MGERADGRMRVRIEMTIEVADERPRPGIFVTLLRDAMHEYLASPVVEPERSPDGLGRHSHSHACDADRDAVSAGRDRSVRDSHNSRSERGP